SDTPSWVAYATPPRVSIDCAAGIWSLSISAEKAWFDNGAARDPCPAQRRQHPAPLVPAKAGTQILDSRLRGNERTVTVASPRGTPSAALALIPSHGNPRLTSRPGVAAAIEEAVLVFLRGGLAVRLDGADLGERGLHRGALVDGVEPAREIGIVLPLHALGSVVASPGEGRDIGDGVILAAEIGHLAEPRLQHLVEALYFRRIAGHRIVAAALGREQLEVGPLAEHRPDPGELNHQ